MSYLSQMVALVIHNFVSAATGIAIAAALAMWALGWLIIRRSEGTLAESS